MSTLWETALERAEITQLSNLNSETSTSLFALERAEITQLSNLWETNATNKIALERAEITQLSNNIRCHLLFYEL